jgi:segregation and condensation protein B
LNRAFQIVEVAGGYQFRTRPELGSWILKLKRQRGVKLSQASLEALAIIAYKQPVTRAEIEYVRGVDSGAVLRGLVEKRLLKILGRKDVPGRPLLYGTSKRFLEVFGLKDLTSLPNLREIQEMEETQPPVGSQPSLFAALDENDKAGQ